MKEYHKIVTVFKRDPDNKFKTLLEGEYAKPEFELLKDIKWIGEEKIDGTNIRVIWDGKKVIFKGKTERADIPARLIEKLQEKFYAGALNEVFDGPVCLYGEGFGSKIQKGGGNYIADGVDFILFDVMIGETWLESENVMGIAQKLQIRSTHTKCVSGLEHAVNLCRTGFDSEFGEFQAEGLVLRPAIELKDRMGHRIITKIKCKDFGR